MPNPAANHVAKHVNKQPKKRQALRAPATPLRRAGTPESNPNRSTFADRLLSPTEIDLSAKNLGEGGMLALLLAALLYLPVTIFNKATEKNHETIKGWFARPRAWLRSSSAGSRSEAPGDHPDPRGDCERCALLLHRAGIPTEQGALEYLIGMVIGFGVVSLVFFTTWRLVLRRLEPESKGEWRLYAPFIVLGGVPGRDGAARPLHPGRRPGDVAEYEPAKKLSVRTAGIRVATTYGVLMVLGLAAWFAWIPVEHAASKEGASSLTLILDSALAITFVSP